MISTATDWRLTSDTAQRKQVEGVILGGNVQPEMVSDFQAQKIAVVLVNNQISGMEMPCVLSDEEDGVRQALQHLTARGHRKVAMLAGRISPYISGERYQAFLQVAQELDIPLHANSIKICEPDIENATDEAMAMLRENDRPTAIFATNDIIASGVLKAAVRIGLQVPRDLAVIGYDDSAICPLLEPALTSVHIKVHTMGRLSIEYMNALLTGQPIHKMSTMVRPELIVRSTI